MFHSSLIWELFLLSILNQIPKKNYLVTKCIKRKKKKFTPITPHVCIKFTSHFVFKDLKSNSLECIS